MHFVVNFQWEDLVIYPCPLLKLYMNNFLDVHTYTKLVCAFLYSFPIFHFKHRGPRNELPSESLLCMYTKC